MHYYQVSLFRSSAPILTYCSQSILAIGDIVTVPTRSTQRLATITSIVDMPTFKTVEILEQSTDYYSPEQMKIAKFISQYYFSSFSEAISLFLPFSKTYQPVDNKNVNTNVNRPCLTHIQQNAYEDILKKDKSLLFGVTGSGKTEVFISLIADMIKQNKTSIFLMPEISLTPQMQKRLEKYFGTTVAMWHSKLTKKKKQEILLKITRGEISIIAGARSALFVPLRNLGLIIIDEEHDDSYKAMTRPRYHARDLALYIGQHMNAKVLLASATPSATSYHRYDTVRLDQPFIKSPKRYQFIQGDSINNHMLKALSSNFTDKNQSLLFLPTRGNFKYLYCENCGNTHLCPYCSVGMALHRKYKHLKCHYCNYTEKIAQECNNCKHAPLKSERLGTAEAIELINNNIEHLVIEQFDRDSISTIKKLKDALNRFENKQSQLLLGTQMLSKGHDYADITLSIIMGLDYIMGLADYRARQKAVSLLYQLAGRSGRAKEALVIIQSSNIEFFTEYLKGYDKFLNDELEFLKAANYPPFCSLARILISHSDEIKASKTTLNIVTKLKRYEDIQIVGQGKAPVERIAGKYRFNILLKCPTKLPLLKALHAVDCREIEIDMDPVEFS